jgi:hypothetical protein
MSEKARTGALVLLFSAGGAIGCNQKTHPAAIVTMPDASEMAPDASLGDPIVALGCGSAGTQSSAAVYQSKVGFVSLAPTTMTQTCTIMPMEQPVTDQVQLWNVCYAELNPDGSFTSKVITSQPYTDPTGAGLAYDANGNPNIAYTGEGAMPSSERCGANDAFIAVNQGGGFAAGVQVSDGSTASGLVAAMMGNCAQNVCNEGDTSGLWPSIAIDAQGTSYVAYRDIHFGFAMDDYAKSNVDLAEVTGTNYSDLEVDVARGAGSYNRVALTPAGLPAVLSYDQTGANPGVYIDVQLKAGNLGAQEATGGWGAAQISNGSAGAQLGFAISPQGLFAAAYYDDASSRLLYVDSMDGMNWSSPQSVDLVGATGFYPSLAFDSSGNPAIAYYRCSNNPAAAGGGGTTMNCDPTQDGLLLARLEGGTWTVKTVRADPAVNDGLYPALAFANGKYYIAYQITTFNEAEMTSSATWWVAEGQ